MGLRAAIRGACLAAAGLVAGCAGPPAAEGEAATVARFVERGFTLELDGRGASGPSVLSYVGDPAGIVVCDGGGATLASAERRVGSVTVRERANVSARLVVHGTGPVQGIYIQDRTRDVVAPGGRIAARELEKITFPAAGAASFSDGTTCRAVL